MPKVTVVELDSAARFALERGYKQGHSAAFRKRCEMILLKIQGRTSSEIGQIAGSCEMSVHNWVHLITGFIVISNKALRVCTPSQVRAARRSCKNAISKRCKRRSKNFEPRNGYCFG